MYPFTALKDKLLKMWGLIFSITLVSICFIDIFSKGKFRYHRKCKWYKYSQSKLILTLTLIFAETIFHCASSLPHCFDCRVLAEVNCYCKLFRLKCLDSLDLDLMSNAFHNSLITPGCLPIEHWLPFTCTDLKSSEKIHSFERFT